MADDKKEKVGISETPNPSSEREEVEAWLRTIQSTIQFRDQIGNKSGWKRFVNEYKGNWDFLQSAVSIPVVPVNLVFAYVKTEIARLYFKDPWITVNAKRVEDIGAAQIAEQILNYTWGELKLKNQIKMALLESLLIGHSWIKLGYAAEFGTVESQPKEEKKGPGRPKKYSQVDTNEYIKSENVFAYYVPYKDIIFDPSATFPATHNARWMAHKIVKPYRAICDSGIYQNTDELKPSAFVDDPNVPYDTPDSIKESFGKDVRSVTLWEIYDLDNQMIRTVSPGMKKYLREIPLPEYLNGGFPFVQFYFNPVPGDVYPMSDIAPHEGQIIELTKILSIELNHLKRWNRQMIVDAETFTLDEMAKFKDANDGAVIQAQTQGAKDKIFIPPYAPVQSDAYGIWNQVYDVWRSIAGQTQTDQGGQAKTQTRTLGELRMQMMGGKARADEKVDVLEDCIAEVARKLLAIMQKEYDLPKIARIVGPRAVQKKIMNMLPGRPSAQPMMPGASPQGQAPGGAPGAPQQPQQQQPNPVAGQSFQQDFAFSWNRQDILGDMDVDVLAGSTVPMDRESQLQIMEKMVPVMQMAGVQPGSPAAKEFAREFSRLVGLMGMEPVMDLADQSPPSTPPKMMEIQAKVQAKQAETKVKLQGKMAEQQLKLQGMKEKLAVDKMKNQHDIQKTLVKSILEQFRTPANGITNGVTNG
jgi:hypothetical protein